jgi:hypothetical protein
MITKTYFDYFNYGSLGVVILLVVLMYTEVIPRGLWLYALIFALLLFIARIVIRLLYVRQNKKDISGG